MVGKRAFRQCRDLNALISWATSRPWDIEKRGRIVFKIMIMLFRVLSLSRAVFFGLAILVSHRVTHQL